MEKRGCNLKLGTQVKQVLLIVHINLTKFEIAAYLLDRTGEGCPKLTLVPSFKLPYPWPCTHAPMYQCTHVPMSPCPHALMSPCPNALISPCPHALMYPCTWIHAPTDSHSCQLSRTIRNSPGVSVIWGPTGI